MLAKNKTIVVTGGGSGMGREMALLLLSKGARVAAIDLNESALAETKKLAGNAADRISLHVLNITDHAAVESLPAEVIAAHGQVDGLINNAGIIQPFVRIKDLDFEAIKRVIDVNLYGVIYMTKAFLPHLLQRPEAHFVNISSMGGFLPVPGQAIYGATKAGVKLMTEALYAELKNTPVRVTIVFPGAIDTNITVNSGVTVPGNMNASEQSKRQTLAADKAAKIIIDGMESDKFRVLVGGDARFLDILYRINPKYATNFILNKMKSLLPD